MLMLIMIDNDANIDNDNFKSLNFKAKYLENTVAGGNTSILKNATIDLPSKYLSIFWRSIAMPLINCKVEWKLRWTKHCVLASAGFENDGADSNNIIFTVKDTKLYVHIISLTSKKTITNCQQLLAKG